jgi:hypothetical protein
MNRFHSFKDIFFLKGIFPFLPSLSGDNSDKGTAFVGFVEEVGTADKPDPNTDSNEDL